jgi:hypothetical protein
MYKRSHQWRFIFSLLTAFRFSGFNLYCDRWSVGQLVLVSGTHFGPTTRFLLLLYICGPAIYSYKSLSLSSTSPSEVMTTSYCLFRDSDNLEDQVPGVPQKSWPHLTASFGTPTTWRTRSPYLYLPGTGWPSYNTGQWVPHFVASYDLQG